MTTRKGGSGSGSGSGGFPPQRPPRAPLPPPRRPLVRPIPGAAAKPPAVRPSVRSAQPPPIAPPQHRAPVVPDMTDDDDGDDDATSVMERPNFESASGQPVFPPPRAYRPPNQPLPAAGRPARPTRPDIDLVSESERNALTNEGTVIMPNAPVRAPARGRTDKIAALEEPRRRGHGEGSHAGRAPREGSQAGRPPREGSQASRPPRDNPSVPGLDALIPAVQRSRQAGERPATSPPRARPPQVANRLGQTTAPFPPNPTPPPPPLANPNETVALPWTPAPPPVNLGSNYPPTPQPPPVQPGPIPRGHHPTGSSAPRPMYPGSVAPGPRSPTHPPTNHPPANRPARPLPLPSIAPQDMTGSLSIVGLVPPQPPGVFGFVLFAAPLALATAAVAALALL